MNADNLKTIEELKASLPGTPQALGVVSASSLTGFAADLRSRTGIDLNPLGHLVQTHLRFGRH